MERRFGTVVIAVAVLALSAAGCQTTDTESVDDSDTSSGTGTEFDDGSLGMRAPVSSATIEDLETVYFDYDKSNIRSDAAAKLRGNAEVIKANVQWGQIVIQGNTDERGSEEYNMALGERRAKSVQRYLIDLGVPQDRLRAVSFGEAKPAVPGHDESAYRYNRRSDFVAR